MKTKFFSLLVALCTATVLWAGNVITYTAKGKLSGYNSSLSVGKTTFGPAIASHTFSNGTGTITCDGEITTIGNRAFNKCSGLTSITIPNTVTSIGNSAFEYCSGLTSITIPNSVTTIGDWAFDNVNNIVYSGIATGSPWGAKCVNGYVEGYLVYSDASKTKLCGCSSAATGEIVIPKSAISIGDRAFEGCSSLTSVTIPNSVTTIGNRAFYGCSKLTSPVYNANCFAYMPTSYKGVYTIPDGIKQIAGYAFMDCRGLTSVTIPNSVTTIGDCAFYDVNNIVYNGYATGSPWGAKCVNGYVDGYFVYTDATKTKLCGCYTTATGEVTIPNTVTSIGNSAFEYCTGLTSITIPNSVTSIGNRAFYGCSGLTSPVYNATIFAYMPTSYKGAYTIPDGIKQIAGYAFYFCSGLTSITIPNSVTTIGDNAFCGCSGLTSVTIPNSVTTIGNYAFEFCSGLTSPVYNATIFAYMPTSYKGAYTIPDGIKQIAGYAFIDCSGLTSITIPNSVTTIGNHAFYDCSNLKTVYNGSNLNIIKGSTDNGYVAYYADIVYNIINDFVINKGTLVAYWGNEESITIPNGITTISEGAFFDYSNLSSVIIPNSVTTIESSAFFGCRKLFDIYCYAIEPPVAQTSSFANYNVYLHVPCDNLQDYQMDAVFGSFKYVECISAEQTQTDDHVTVTPSDYNATFTWPANDQAAGYSIEITKDGVVFCTLKFNAQGQLTGIAFAPSRDGEREMPAATMTANGWQFTVTGLNAASKYSYTIDALNAGQQSIKHYEGEFATDGYTGLDRLTIDNTQGTVRKIIHNNQMQILRNGNLFNALGGRVR